MNDQQTNSSPTRYHQTRHRGRGMNTETQAALQRLRGTNAVGIGADWQDWLRTIAGSHSKPNVTDDIILAAELALAENPLDDGEAITPEWLGEVRT